MKFHLHLVSRLKKRGWDERELDYANRVMMEANGNKTPTTHFFESALLWSFLMIVGLGNLFVISTIIPLFIIFPNIAIYATLMVLGITFGLLTEIVVRDLESLFAEHHYYVMYILIPFIAASGGLLILSYAQSHLPNFFLLSRNPLTMSIVYTVFFIAPLAFSRVYLKLKYSKKEAL